MGIEDVKSGVGGGVGKRAAEGLTVLLLLFFSRFTSHTHTKGAAETVGVANGPCPCNLHRGRRGVVDLKAGKGNRFLDARGWRGLYEKRTHRSQKKYVIA